MEEQHIEAYEVMQKPVVNDCRAFYTPRSLADSQVISTLRFLSIYRKV